MGGEENDSVKKKIVSSCENGNELYGFMKGGECLI